MRTAHQALPNTAAAVPLVEQPNRSLLVLASRYFYFKAHDDALMECSLIDLPEKAVILKSLLAQFPEQSVLSKGLRRKMKAQPQLGLQIAGQHR